MKTKQRCHPFHQRLQRPFSVFSFAIGATAAFLMALPAMAASNVNNAPTLKLFPTTVVESIKETGQSARGHGGKPSGRDPGPGKTNDPV